VAPVPERPVASIFGDFMILDERGKFRAPGVTTLMAKTDFEAVEEWLGVISLKSKNTFDAYAREVERLMIWVNRERQKSLSDINLADALAFREMLLSPPAHWVSPLPLSRSSPDWRPLRGPLSGASLNRAMAAISSLFKFLVQQNYLVANPFASIPGKRDTNRMDVFRSFGPRDQEAIGSTLDSLEPTLFTRRLRAILKVLLNTGLRRDELASAKWSQIKTNRLHDETEHLLHIIGKGEKPRIIPLRPDVYQELVDHRSDYYSLMAAGEMPGLPLGHDDPLIFSLKKFGDHDLHAATLSDDGIYSALKSFFQKVAVRFSGEEYANFELASTHWMRHTFAHEVLKATDNDLSVVKELMGHASISTTGIYLQANQAEQSAAVNKIPSRF
jgi:site-specific recombinase XerD